MASVGAHGGCGGRKRCASRGGVTWVQNLIRWGGGTWGGKGNRGSSRAEANEGQGIYNFFLENY